MNETSVDSPLILAIIEKEKEKEFIFVLLFVIDLNLKNRVYLLEISEIEIYF